ncbi:response regulator [Burkholderia vietnamiensis]|uniref:Response regulator transcription factor n=1 Tax=Burkholderia vietnamiensis TaxID=60552 RepID=A0AAW7SYV3_BURVI|nr:response regulator transcription factor [Burkholderia vietnamiensis]MBH9644326.1 response regulator transcription factor [Burkholderia vietnamiensis]MCA7948167.1 response regulator transcription factor [Burkholderia vietnamiensis]MDN7794974.1 response regulator transcription factor [Burkholderia vietnamiensis]HDR8969306.1 response regulator transcription factor [Burkholderia vietnamiensis]HDR9020507.1 response regulator transcription factor [Burkholderia vietnamiensis]
MKILIVDDHPILRDGVAALLRQNGEDVTVAQAGNADDAMRMLDQSADFDAIVLDLKLPGMNGLDAISAFAGKCPQLQIIVLSTSEDAADVRAAFARGALGYVPKSAGPHTVLSAIRMVLDGERYVPPLMLDDSSSAASGSPRPAPATRSAGPLTQRQIEVLRYVAEGVPNKVIADRLNLSEKTVKAHVTAIFKALNVLNRTQAAAAARKAGLL